MASQAEIIETMMRPCSKEEFLALRCPLCSRSLELAISCEHKFFNLECTQCPWEVFWGFKGAKWDPPGWWDEYVREIWIVE